MQKENTKSPKKLDFLGITLMIDVYLLKTKTTPKEGKAKIRFPKMRFFKVGKWADKPRSRREGKAFFPPLENQTAGCSKCKLMTLSVSVVLLR